MATAVSKYIPVTHPPTEDAPAYAELRLLSVNEARKILGIRYETMKRLIENGSVRYLNLEGKIKIPYYELQNYLEISLIRNNLSNSGSEIGLESRINQLFKKYN